MFAAALVLDDSFLYELFFFLHVLTAVVGFGSTFVYAMAGPRAAKAGGPVAAWVTRFLYDASKTLTTPFIYATGAFGLLMVFMSDVVEFDQAWVNIALGLFVAGAVVGYLLTQNGKQMVATVAEMEAAGPPAAGGPPPQVAKMQELGKRQGMLSGVAHLIFLLMLIDMVWKPGF